jgi:hypothetical protein
MFEVERKTKHQLGSHQRIHMKYARHLRFQSEFSRHFFVGNEERWSKIDID